MRRFGSVIALGAMVLAPGAASAQYQMNPRWEIRGLDFAPNGAWRVKGRRVAERRARLFASGAMETLNAPGLAGGGGAAASGSELVVGGTMQVPVIMFRYLDTPAANYASRDTSNYNAVLFATSPPLGRPYTLRTFYEQLSTIGANPPLFSVQGQAFGWAALLNGENTYTGGPGCNGLCTPTAMQNGLREALALLDAQIDFGQYDNDGVDGLPNSGDDDGVVDIAVFVHATMDGSCGGANNNHIWAHRWVLAATGSGAYTTGDTRNPGGFIRVNDYIVQSALGGTSSCDTTQIMPIGTVGHELGHGLGLPDLYDTGGLTEGIGEWGLMSSGSFAVPVSPSRMEAYSLQFLGWITLRQITVSGTYTLGPVPIADTAFVIRPTGGNPNQEYFLLENRQRVPPDTGLIRRACAREANPPGCGGGLLVWHVDSAKVQTGDAFNNVNSGTIHGLKLEEADGLRELWCEANGCNRGDAGDPWPGTANRTRFSVTTTPSAIKNSNGSPLGFALDSITQVVLDGEMSVVVRIGGVTTVRGSDSAAVVQVNSANYNVFRDILSNGGTYTLNVADTQVSGSGRTRWAFLSWSDGGSRQHDITAGTTDTTFTASLQRAFKLIVNPPTNGTVTDNQGGLTLSAGVFRDEGASVELTATPNSGFVFNGWTGDSTTANAVVSVPMGRPYTLTAVFEGVLAITKPTALRGGFQGAGYADTLTASGGSTPYSWSLVSGALPSGAVLNGDGTIAAGEVTQQGTFNFTAQVIAGSQTQQQAFSITVSAPTLVTQSVVNHILDPATGTLTLTEQRYLDLIGNNNGGLDLGDFLAWVDATGAPLSPEIFRVVQGKGGRR